MWVCVRVKARVCVCVCVCVCVRAWGGGAKLIWGLIPPYGSSSINDPHRLRHRAKSHLTLNLSYLLSLCLSTHPLILRAGIKEPERNKESHLEMHIKGESGTFQLCVHESLSVISSSTHTHNARPDSPLKQHNIPLLTKNTADQKHNVFLCEHMCGECVFEWG